jgi:hypothetical protein
LLYNCFAFALISANSTDNTISSSTSLFSLARYYNSGFNYVIRIIIVTCPIWFKTLSFTYFHDYLQVYQALANSTDAAILSSLFLSLPSIIIQALVPLIRTTTRSFLSSRLSSYGWITTTLHSLRFPLIPWTPQSCLLCFPILSCQASITSFV